MKVCVLQVDCCKPILGLDAFDHAPVRQHLERETVQGPVQHSQIQDWSKTTAFLGYEEVRAVKALHRDWQNRGVPVCHQSLQNAAELGRLPSELNRVAELNCAHEPTCPVHHAGAGCAGSPLSASALPRTAGQNPQRCRRTAQPGRWPSSLPV